MTSLNLDPKTWLADAKKARKGDTVYLECGQTYQGKLPIIAGVEYSYSGTGPRPIIHNDGLAIWEKNGLQGVLLNGLHFTGKGCRVSMISGAQGWEDFEFIDTIIDGEIALDDGNNGVWNRNIRVRRCILTGSHYERSSLDQKVRPSNIYVEHTDGFLLENSVLDYGGWHPTLPDAAANQYCHNLYTQYINNEIVVRGNLLLRPAAHSAQMRSGGEFEHNATYQHSIGMNMGYGLELKPTDGYGLNNIFLEPVPMAMKGDRPGRGTNLITPALFGMALASNPGSKWHVGGNIYGKPQIDTKGLVVKHYTFEDVVKGSKSGDAEIVRTAPDVVDADLTLTGYARDAGFKDAEAFIDAAKTRQVGTWDDRLSGRSVYEWGKKAVATKPVPTPAPTPKPAPPQRVEVSVVFELVDGKVAGVRLA